MSDRPSWKPPFYLKITPGASWTKPGCNHYSRVTIESYPDPLSADRVQSLRAAGHIPDGMSFRRIGEVTERTYEVPMTDNEGNVFADQGTRDFKVWSQTWEIFYCSGD